MSGKLATKETPTPAELAEIKTYAPIQQTAEQRAAALETWDAYSQFLELPFVPKEAAAHTVDAVFGIVKLGEGELPTMEDPDVSREVWMLLVQFERECSMQTRGGEIRAFKEGQRALIPLNKNRITNRTAMVIAQNLATNLYQPDMCLVQMEPKKKGHSGAVVLARANSDVALAAAGE